MDTQTHQQGIGLAVMIVIIAIIGVGGVAGVQYYNQQKAAVDTEEMAMDEESTQVVANTSASARAQLTQLQTDIQSGVAVNAEQVLARLSEIRAGLTGVYDTLNASAQAELEVLEEIIVQAQAEVETELGTLGDTIGSAVDNMDEAMGITTESDMEVDATMGQNHDEDTHMNDTDAMDMGAEATTSVSTDSSIDGEMGDMSTDTEASVEAEADALMNI